MKKTKKQFECQEGCEERELELLIFGCKKCIKKVGIEPTKEHKEQIKYNQ